MPARPPTTKKGQYQPPMSERTCSACGTKGHRSDHCPLAAGKSEPAKPPASCGYCHQPAGAHSKNCKKRDGCKICAKVAPKKCWFHSGQGEKPGPKGPRSMPARPVPETAVSLSRIKVAIAEHERKAAALREALAILEA